MDLVSVKFLTEKSRFNLLEIKHHTFPVLDQLVNVNVNLEQGLIPKYAN